QPDPNRAKACVAGETLPANTGCTAYVGFRPETVDPAVANVRVGAGVYRFTGSGYQNVVVARGDTKGDATFAGTPEIISKDSAGQPINGSEPSLSADGRYVAFVSSAIIDRPPGSTEQVYRHDRVAGQTVLISALPDGTVSGFGASQPSSSSSGNRIAFITNGRQDDGPGIPSQVYARDVAARKVILVSAVHGSSDKLGDGWSNEPSLSDDGSTVGFTSGASDLVTEPGNEFDAVFVRYLDPDFAAAPAAQRFSERVSLTAAGAAPDTGSSGSPALSSDGAFTAFDSTSQLVATDTDSASDVYVRRRPAQLVVDPASVDFGPVKVATTTPPRRMTVRNIGMGPAAAGPGTTAAPFAPGDNRCTVTLHRGESCVVDATFKPVVPGRADALLNLPSVQGYLPGPAVAVTLTGTGTTVPPPAGLSVVPDQLVFPARQLGQSGPPSKVVLRNTGGVPLTVKPTLTSPAGDFGADLTACASLMPAAQCEFSVDFVPRSPGQRNGSIVFTPTSQDPVVKSPTPVTVALVGSGTPGPAVASLSVEPRTLLFGPQILLSNSAPRSIAVTNTGTVPLDVTAVSANADFTSVSTCGRIQPGQRCEIAVRFVPRALGTRSGAVQVAAGVAGAGVAAPFPVSVGLRGTAPTPLLQVEPPVVRPGQIVLATGTNFPPGRPVVLAWQTGLGTQQVVADGAGRFQTAVLVFRRDVLGQRLVAAQIPGQSVSVNSVPVLVMPLGPQPPNFVLRW
ncbi:MAG TPA: choice-of-anchor D domain-containing protein, partial [Kribbella sp.]